MRRPAAGGQIFLRRTLVWAAVLLLTGGLIALVIGPVWFRSYLGGEGFRQVLSQATSRALRAKGEYEPLRHAGSTIYSDRFAAVGGAKAAFQTLVADQARAEFNLGGLWRGSWQIDDVQVQRLQVSFRQRPELRGRIEEELDDRRSPPRGSGFFPAWLPARVDLKKATVQEALLEWGDTPGQAGSLRGTRLEISPQGSAWNIVGTGGTLVQGSLPPLTLREVRLRHQGPSLFITDAQLAYGEGGTVGASGEAVFGDRLDLRIQLNGIPLTPFLQENWRLRLTGKAGGDIRVLMPLSGAGAADVQGTVTITEGHLTALPVLDQIALFTRTQQFREIALTKVSARFVQKIDRLNVTEFTAESEGLIRVEGAFTIGNGEINGAFEVGVTAASLQWLPGSQAKVFTVARGGYLWTPMRLSGPLQNPTDDLRPRLAAAAGDAVIEGVEAVARDAAKGVLESPRRVFDLFDQLIR